MEPAHASIKLSLALCGRNCHALRLHRPGGVDSGRHRYPLADGYGCPHRDAHRHPSADPNTHPHPHPHRHRHRDGQPHAHSPPTAPLAHRHRDAHGYAAAAFAHPHREAHPHPYPGLDFRIASWRLWPLALNSGCAKGMHTIFITVLDVTGAPLDNIIIGDSWNNVEVVSGQKGPAKAEIDLWTNTMEMVIKRNAVTGQPYTSEVSFPFSSFLTTIPDEQMINAGYCANELECQWKRANESFYCGGHYSWEVIFQATR